MVLRAITRLRPLTILWVVLVVGAALVARGGRLVDVEAVAEGEKQRAESPVLMPDEALAAFEIEPGYEIALFAAEPMIEDPVAMAFDEDGRLWVVEMRSYMPNVEGAGELVPVSRVVVLEDTDADGRADRSTVFLDGLVLPRAILPCFGGLLVIEPPNLLFCRDTNGDGKADQKRVLLTGFDGHENPEHAGNALRWGVDNWIHLSQFKIDLKFDGQSVLTRPVPVQGQWGMTLDEWGRLYTTPNSESLRGDLLPRHYARRDASSPNIRTVYHKVGRDAATFSIRPNTGVNRGYQPRILRDDGRLAWLTAACGPAMCHSSRWDDAMRGSVFVCEPAGNLVKVIRRDHDAAGLPFWVNAFKDREFLASRDERFRPVEAQFGPDGALYIADMYRGVIQHRIYLTEYLSKEIRARNLEKPMGMGRIWRIAPEKSEVIPTRQLSQASDEQLVELLAHEDQWLRLTAQRLLVERRAIGVAPAIRALGDNLSPWARLHGLWTLEGIGALVREDIERALSDAHPAVASAGCQLAERELDAELIEKLAELAAAGPILLRAQAALSLGADSDAAFGALVGLARGHAGDAILRSAIIASLGANHGRALRELAVDAAWPGHDADRAMLSELADAALRGSGAVEVVELAAMLASDRTATAELLLARVAAWQRLNDARPRRLALSHEPTGWSQMLSQRSGRLGDLAARIDGHLAWPGRIQDAPVQLTSDQEQLFARGARLYTYCQGCHGADGEGMGSQYPPLAGSPRVLADAGLLTRVLLHGLEGQLTREGRTYNEAMPPAPLGSDRDFAAVMTYIRRSWGNDAEAVDAQLVEQVRRETRGRNRPWRADELE